MAGTIAELGHQFELSGLAEVIGHADQRALLAAIGCDASQGYFTEAPRLPDAF